MCYSKLYIFILKSAKRRHHQKPCRRAPTDRKFLDFQIQHSQQSNRTRCRQHDGTFMPCARVFAVESSDSLIGGCSCARIATGWNLGLMMCLLKVMIASSHTHRCHFFFHRRFLPLLEFSFSSATVPMPLLGVRQLLKNKRLRCVTYRWRTPRLRRRFHRSHRR
jgi:hypothetical protein